MADTQIILNIAMPLPLPQLFDYRPPEGDSRNANQFPIGARVEVPFGSNTLIGVLVSTSTTSQTPPDKIKAALVVLDDEACIPTELLQTCKWGAHYYHHPLGEVLAAALPKRYRKGEPREDVRPTAWVHTNEGLGLPEGALKRSVKQQALHQALLKSGSLRTLDCDTLGISPAVCKALANKGLIEQKVLEQPRATELDNILASEPLTLNQEQDAALTSLRYHEYQCSLLQGVTGSGKTEVYMQAIARTLQAGKQALVLIPEIGLTPQTLARFRKRFRVDIAELHSRVSDLQRAQAWEKARSGLAPIIIGTRLAALTPANDLGLIIIDEEHDASFKQQDGWRYSARDLSIYRAHSLNIPIILGSATPSLESLNNALAGRYQHLILSARAGGSLRPNMRTIDLRGQTLNAGLSTHALAAIQQSLDKGKQAMVFINRRGYAPLLHCKSCGWHARCTACDMNFTLHQSPPRLHCHHCEARRGIPTSCPNCKSQQLSHSGAGTEQVVELLAQHFHSHPTIRIDRDTTQTKNAMAKLLSEAMKGEPCILVGTQMLAKGHHLEALDSVIVLDTDQGLMSSDYKALERLGQLLTQVAGRAGRESEQGSVFLQTYQPEHPNLKQLIAQGYEQFALQLLTKRQEAGLPPFQYSALFRSESKRGENAIELLAFIKRHLQQELKQDQTNSIRLLGPFPAIIEKLNGRYRFQLQLYASDRRALHHHLTHCLSAVRANALSRRTRWSLDIDPHDHS